MNDESPTKIMCFVVLWVSFLGFNDAYAGKLKSVEENVKEIVLNEPYEIRLVFDGDENNISCGLKIDWGDGQIVKLRVGADQQLRPPYKVQHVYSTTGPKKILVEGETLIRGLRSLSGCDARFSGVKTVIDPVEEDKKAIAREESLAAKERLAAERANILAEKARADADRSRAEMEKSQQDAERAKARAETQRVNARTELEKANATTVRENAERARAQANAANAKPPANETARPSAAEVAPPNTPKKVKSALDI